MFFDNDIKIEQLPLSDRESKRLAQSFCDNNGLKLDERLDYFCGAFEGSKMLAGGGFDGDTIKCVAVDKGARERGLTNTVVSHLRSILSSRGVLNSFVYTKRQNRELFESLAFYFVGQSDDSVLLESNPRGVKRYCEFLKTTISDIDGKELGGIVLNANPFTLGHRKLVEQAKKQCDILFLFVVEENKSIVNFEDRLRLVKDGVKDIEGVVAVPSGKYIVSYTTFPNYFLKESKLVDKNCAQLDADVFGRHIASALNITKRFVGTEPSDIVTADYNAQLKNVLSKYGVELIEQRRFEVNDEVVSASVVRKLLAEDKTEQLKCLVPQTTFEFLTGKEGDYVRFAVKNAAGQLHK